MRKADLDENQSQPRIMMSWRQEAGMYKAVPENVARRWSISLQYAIKSSRYAVCIGSREFDETHENYLLTTQRHGLILL